MTGQIAASARRAVGGRRQSAVAALAVLSLLTAGWRVLDARGDVRDAEVVLRDAAGVTVAVGSAAPRPGRDGESLPRGAVVSTGAEGRATLDVRGRLVRLAPETAVGVPDGATADLRRGSILVDRREGPEVAVVAGLLTVDDVERGALRVDRGFSTRVSVYSGSARASTSGRALDVPRLHVVAIAGRALPDRPAPLQLRGDAWERSVIPEVVAADVTLARLARGLDSAREVAAGTAAVLPAGYRAALAALPPSVGRSEALLPVAIGEAAGGDERVSRAQALRDAGASWGVVASLVGARSSDVAAELAALLRGAVPPSEGPATVAGGQPQPGDDRAEAGPQPTPGPGGSPRPGASGRPSPGGSPRPSPSSSPSPSEGIVETIRRLLPSASGTPVPPVLVAPSALSAR